MDYCKASRRIHITIIISVFLFVPTLCKWNWRFYVNGLYNESVTILEKVELDKILVRKDYTIKISGIVGGTVTGTRLNTFINNLGIDLNSEVRPETIISLKEDLLNVGFLLFKEQGILSPEQHLKITKWFGLVPPENSRLGQFAKVHYLSNDPEYGETNVGVTGWHTDGYCAQYPYSHVTLHAINISTQGDTLISSIPKVLKKLSPKFLDFLGTLSFKFLSGVVKDRKNPLLVKHHRTGQQTLQIYFGTKCERILVKTKNNNEYIFSDGEKKNLGQFFDSLFQQPDVMSRLHWSPGDLLIMDNWLVAHLATPDTQFHISKIGLRRLQRTVTFPTGNIEGFAWNENWNK